MGESRTPYGLIAQARAELGVAASRGLPLPIAEARAALGDASGRGLPLSPPVPPWPEQGRAPEHARRAVPRFLVQRLRRACELLLPTAPEPDPVVVARTMARLRRYLRGVDGEEDLAALGAFAASATDRGTGYVELALHERWRGRPPQVEVRSRDAARARVDQPPQRSMPGALADALVVLLDRFEALSREPADAPDPLLDRVLPALRAALARHLPPPPPPSPPSPFSSPEETP